MAISIDFEVTNRCNASCHFCPRDRTPHQGLMSEAVFEKGLARAIEYRDVLRSIDAQDSMISLCGLGEPLLNKHTASFARQVREAGFYCAMSSNGALLDERRGRELLDAGLNEILINCGERDEAYEDIYKLPWAKTRDNIVRFTEMAGDDCEVLLVLVNHRRDADHQAEMREFWGQYGVKAFHEYEIMNRGGSLFIDEMQYARHPESKEAFDLLHAGGNQPFCSAPFLGFFLGYDGNYYLCCSDWEKTVPVGTVFDDDFISTIEEKMRYVSSRGPVCQACNHDPVNRITEELRAVADGVVERSTVDNLVGIMQTESRVMVDGLEKLVPGIRQSVGAPDPAPDDPGQLHMIAGDQDDRVVALDQQVEALVADHRIAEAIDALTAANRIERDPRIESQLVHLRHAAFHDLEASEGPATWPRVVPDQFEGASLPAVERGELTADVLASAVTNHGCLHVRGLLDPAGVDQMVGAIDEAFRACDAKQFQAVDVWPGSWFQAFTPPPPYPAPENFHRAWVRHAGGVLAADSPPAFFTMVELFEAAGLREVIAGYLGDHPVFAVDKVTLRRVPVDLKVAEWHQDGAFLGHGIRTLNVWLALTDCGGDLPSPGLELVPKRCRELLPTGTDGAYFDWSIGHDVAVGASADAPIIRPVFRAGDALLFDEMLLHRTAIDPDHDRERYAIESWFFAGTRYPDDSTPIVF